MSNELVAKGISESIAYIRQNLHGDTWQFTHNDLNAENILVDDTGENIIGVLDFGDAHIPPVASDYYLWDKWPHEVMKRVALIASEENDHFDAQLARSIHRVYVVNDIVDCRQAQDEGAEKTYWRELERVYNQRAHAEGTGASSR